MVSLQNISNITNIGDLALKTCKVDGSLNFSGVTYVGYGAISQSSYVKELNFPSLTSISNASQRSDSGIYPFINGCNSLEKFYAPNLSGNISQTMYAQSYGTYTNGTFSYCPNLKSITLGRPTSFGHCTFADLPMLQEFNVDLSGITVINTGVFKNNGYSGELNFPNLTTIDKEESQAHRNGYSPFFRCNASSIKANKLTSTYNCTLHGRESYQDMGAFGYCFNLRTIELESITQIGTATFFGSDNLRMVYAPNVTTINPAAFAYTRSLAQNMIFNKLTKFYSVGTTGNVANSPFLDSGILGFTAKILTEIPDGSQGNNGNAVFQRASSMKYIRIPKITKIGNNAFYQCGQLKYVIIDRDISQDSTTVISSLGTNAFYGCSSIRRIIVPEEYIDGYKSATNWTAQASKIFGFVSVSVHPETPVSGKESYAYIDDNDDVWMYDNSEWINVTDYTNA